MGITVILPDGSGVPGPKVELAGRHLQNQYADNKFVIPIVE